MVRKCVEQKAQYASALAAPGTRLGSCLHRSRHGRAVARSRSCKAEIHELRLMKFMFHLLSQMAEEISCLVISKLEPSCAFLQLNSPTGCKPVTIVRLSWNFQHIMQSSKAQTSYDMRQTSEANTPSQLVPHSWFQRHRILIRSLLYAPSR